jgi:hypothetical protein
VQRLSYPDLAARVYRSERNENWLKIKTVQKGKFPVIGFVKDPTGVAALYLGKKEGKELVYMGIACVYFVDSLQCFQLFGLGVGLPYCRPEP